MPPAVADGSLHDISLPRVLHALPDQSGAGTPFLSTHRNGFNLKRSVTVLKGRVGYTYNVHQSVALLYCYKRLTRILTRK